MPPLSEEPKSGFIRVKYELMYTSDVPLSAYDGMTPEQAVAYELDLDGQSVIEVIMSSDDDDKLIIARNAQYVTE